MKLKVAPTNDRGFLGTKFKDYDGDPCHLIESSLATDYCIHFGREEGTHHLGYCLASMHLSREQVADLLPLLQRFVETGRLEEPAE